MAALWLSWFVIGLSSLLTGRLASGQSITAYRNIEQKLRELEAKVTQITDSLNQTGGVPATRVKNQCPAEFYEHEATQSCYRVMSDGKSWYEARMDCQNQGAQLAWFDSMVEYRHVVIKLLTDIVAEKDYNNTGYWSSANDITGGSMVWDDSDAAVPSFFTSPGTRSQSYRYSSSYYSSASSRYQRHCMFMKYEGQRMQITQEMSECDFERLYICKCKTDTSGRQGCPSKAELPRPSVINE